MIQMNKQISTLTNEIKELVNGIDYKKANYTRVDHYLNSIPKDLIDLYRRFC